MALIAAFDPGSSQTGWALVSGGQARVRFVQAGRIESSDAVFVELLRDLAERNGEQASLVAVEQAAGFIYDKQRSAQVIATAAVGGGLSWTARVLGYPVVAVPATTVRTVIVGKAKLGFRQRAGDMDRAIKAALPAFVEGMPARSNEHVRDALALAVAANWMWMGEQRRRVA